MLSSVALEGFEPALQGAQLLDVLVLLLKGQEFERDIQRATLSPTVLRLGQPGLMDQRTEVRCGPAILEVEPQDRFWSPDCQHDRNHTDGRVKIDSLPIGGKIIEVCGGKINCHFDDLLAREAEGLGRAENFCIGSSP